MKPEAALQEKNHLLLATVTDLKGQNTHVSITNQVDFSKNLSKYQTASLTLYTCSGNTTTKHLHNQDVL